MKNIKILMLLCLLLLNIVSTCFAMYQNEMSQVIEQSISAILKSKATTSCIVTCHAANTVLNPSLQRNNYPTFTTQEKPIRTNATSNITVKEPEASTSCIVTCHAANTVLNPLQGVEKIIL